MRRVMVNDPFAEKLGTGDAASLLRICNRDIGQRSWHRCFETENALRTSESR